MIYGYTCLLCEHSFEVIKRASEYDKDEQCARCGGISKREFAPRRVHLSHTAVQEAEFNPGLGCIVKNRQHRAEICKSRGFEEIGNEKPDTIHKHFDRQREERKRRSWDEADRGWVGEG